MHSHAHPSHTPAGSSRLWLSLGITLAFTAFEAAAGWWSQSLGLISDAGHNLSDALALGLAAWAMRIARQPATARRTFGYHRVGILSALFNAATLVVIALWIAAEAWERFRHPAEVASGAMMGVAGAGFVLNTAIALLIRHDARHSLNHRAAFVHMVGDALASLAVVASGVIIHFTGWVTADPLVSVLIAVLIVVSGWGILREAFEVLTESAPMDTAKVHEALLAMPGIQDVHDLHVWRLADGIVLLSCHVVLAADTTLAQCAAVTQEAGRALEGRFGIGHATIQAEPAGACHDSDHPPHCSIH